MNTKGMVYLVGAGPGDPGLLTIRAARLMSSADVLIYDNLVNKIIIDTYCPETCEKIYVGKSGSKHTLEQDDINNLIVKKARENKSIVRLKGGDPFIFGRGGEEALVLKENNVPFEIVNGISSAYAVPAYAGIPVTHRGISASVAFITGHEDPTKLDSDIHWDKIATGLQTLVFLMGVKNLPLIMENLVKHGINPDTPAAVIQNGCYPAQRTVTGTVQNIHEKVIAENIKPPSIIVVGEVVKIRESVNWFEKRPLFGKNIIVTRSREQASKVVSDLSELGAGVIEMPSIKIAPSENPDEINKAIESLGGYDWIIFTSTNGVDYFFRHLIEKGHDSRSLHGCNICAIGSATAEALNRFGIHADLVPEKFISTQIAEELQKRNEIKGKYFLLPRADIAPKDLADFLVDKGARVDDIAIYKTAEEEYEKSAISTLLKDGNVDLVTFTSSSTARNFAAILSKTDIPISDNLKCAAIGPVTAETAKKIGFNIVFTAETHTIDCLVESIVRYFKGV